MLLLQNSSTLNRTLPNSSKTLTVAKQTEVLFLKYVTIALHTTIEDDARQFTKPLPVAEVKSNFLGTPFFEEHILKIIIQDFTLHVQYQSKHLAKFT